MCARDTRIYMRFSFIRIFFLFFPIFAFFHFSLLLVIFFGILFDGGFARRDAKRRNIENERIKIHCDHSFALSRSTHNGTRNAVLFVPEI